jgi:hypothetical protein
MFLRRNFQLFWLFLAFFGAAFFMSCRQGINQNFVAKKSQRLLKKIPSV